MATDTSPASSVRGTLEPLAPPGRAAIARAWTEQRLGVIALGITGILLILVVIAIGERLAHRNQILPGVTVAGHDLGGSTEPAALDTITAIGARLRNQTIHARAGDHDLSFAPSAIGYEVDAAATVRAARRAGRETNPINALTGALFRNLRPDHVPFVVRYDPHRLAMLIDGWVGTTGKGLIDGGIRFEGVQVAEIRPRPGVGIDRDDAERRVLDAIRHGSTDLGSLRIGPTTPAIDLADVRHAARRARAILAAPVAISAGTATLTLTPAQVATTLRTHISDSRLRLRVDEIALRVALGAPLTAVETTPKDAEFAIDGTRVAVVPSVSGVLVDLGPVGTAMARAHHAVTAPLRTSEPARSTQWATKLNITELVATYTTNHPCCQPRITNIHRGADTISGTIVEPGATFSLNEALGARTVEKGYVLAPGIGANLEFEDSVGGGVSQLSTTLYNATFFGCYQDITHTVHALYISRYPMGREATLNFPSIDNKFRNDSRSGVLIRVGYTSTSVSVSFYGNPEGRSCRAEGPTILETIPIAVEYVDDPALPIGTEKMLAPGALGYVVENFRIISRFGVPDVRERYVERYSMAKAKVARGTGPPAPAPPPGIPPAIPPVAPPASGPPGTPPASNP